MKKSAVSRQARTSNPRSSTGLGTIGGGNHFAEIQVVERSFRRWWVQGDWLGQTATRDAHSQRFARFGESILRKPRDEHFGEAVEAFFVRRAGISARS